MSEVDTASRAGFCALLGAPNAGKSTLLNRLCGVKLAAVSPKPQTTRDRILGVVNRPASADTSAAQLVFVDTPGVERGRGLLRRYMHEEASQAVDGCDVVVLVVDAARAVRKARAPRAELDELLKKTKSPVVLVLNKVDVISDKGKLLPLLEELAEDTKYSAIVPVSAATGVGVDGLVDELVAHLPLHPPLYPDGMLTDRPDRFRAAEFVREQLFHQLSQEIPYGTAVAVRGLEEHHDSNALTIEATVYVDRDSQKGMVIGKGGSRIKEIGKKARAVIGESLNRPVHLRLDVKTLSGWHDNPARLRDLGYGA